MATINTEQQALRKEISEATEAMGAMFKKRLDEQRKADRERSHPAPQTRPMDNGPALSKSPQRARGSGRS